MERKHLKPWLPARLKNPIIEYQRPPARMSAVKYKKKTKPTQLEIQSDAQTRSYSRFSASDLKA